MRQSIQINGRAHHLQNAVCQKIQSILNGFIYSYIDCNNIVYSFIHSRVIYKQGELLQYDKKTSTVTFTYFYSFIFSVSLDKRQQHFHFTS
uniref:Uncharacterized protein n=1 Tax=Octopus bimaculoides TaxID=37653 RepID=A0A0L8G826_OCTBM